MTKNIVLDAIKALHQSNKFRYVGKDWGQLDMTNPAVAYPCALVDLPGFEDTAETKSTNKIAYTISVRFADMIPTISSQSPDMSASLNYMDRMDDIIELLKQYQYQFVRAYDNPERENVTDYILVFRKTVRTAL